MSTFPLYTLQPPHADGWHSVRAPGGYEWWYFDAEDPRNDRQLVAIFFQGFAFHPGYLRADARYRRSPTNRVPALPSNYPSVYFAVYEHGQIRGQFLTQFNPDEFAASADSVNVRIGPNRITDSGNSLQLQLKGAPWQHTAFGPGVIKGSELSAELQFIVQQAPAPSSRRFISRAVSGADHYWILANPHCQVSGSIRVGEIEFSFNGRGYHDHNFGSAPLGPGLRRWMWGRVISESTTQAFQWTQPVSGAVADEMCLVRCDAYGTLDLPVSVPIATREKLTSAGLRYPETVTFSSNFRLARPRVLDASPFYLRLQYQAILRGESATALCEIAYPQRLSWPILGRMIEMAIDKRSLSGARR